MWSTKIPLALYGAMKIQLINRIDIWQSISYHQI